MFGLGLPELIVIFLVILLLFGAKNLPEIAKNLGKGIKAFKKETSEAQDDVKTDKNNQDETEKTHKT